MHSDKKYSTYSIEAVEMAQQSIEFIKNGKVRNHKLGNSAPIHQGAIERKECRIYKEFLPTKNYDFIYNLKGSEIYE